jgi:hypothetical protein
MTSLFSSRNDPSAARQPGVEVNIIFIFTLTIIRPQGCRVLDVKMVLYFHTNTIRK